MATKGSLNDETMAFMKSIGLAPPSTENSKPEKKDKKRPQVQAPEKKNKIPIEKKDSKKSVTERKKTPTPKSNNVKEKPKVKARKWGKESKEAQAVEIVPKTNSTSSSLEINWLHVKVDSNQQILTAVDDQKWYHVISSFDQLNFHDYKISKSSLEEINKTLPSLYSQEVMKYHKNKAFNGEEKWMNDVIKSGTLSDKVAALALRVQQSPPHELEAFDQLINMALKKEQRTSQLALEAIKDLLIHNLLPDDRRLVPYTTRPLGHPNMSLAVLLTFWYENELIKRIESIITALDTALKSTVDYFKMKCMEIVSSWLSSKPEQENVLLTLLVNKLGDPSSKVGGKCITLLSNVVYEHPAMKLVMIREVRQLISRSNLIPRAIYSGVLFLSQIKLSTNENKVAMELVDCYVSLFEKAVTQDTLGSKLLAALLSGINRAFPFLINKTSLSKHTDALFRIVHQSSFSSATQALTLLSYLALGHQPDNVASKKKKEKKESTSVEVEAEAPPPPPPVLAPPSGEGDLISRYYNTLYAKLLSDEVNWRPSLSISLTFCNL
jgi:hypothetical protein